MVCSTLCHPEAGNSSKHGETKRGLVNPELIIPLIQLLEQIRHTRTGHPLESGWIERGEALFRGGKLAEGMPACTGCHSPNGAGLAAAGFPKLGGQHGQYVAKQLTDFREGNRTNDGDAMTMRAIAAKLSNKDIEAVSSYIQGLH